ncbi:Golgi-to-ER vesicle coat component [Podospora pseudopauciseta]|uniref:Coatomer subunit zeta n=1 Tax=Podospora pseudopauciseta TaxID=2093780 RepID=A0ABR0HYC1_9PEZI|nr:Golgi-to-ER vesicle coat component [Podospora pseudopauciseta]
MAPGMSLYSVNAILILSSEDGSRIFSKWYNPPHQAANQQPSSTAAPASAQNPFADKTAQVRFEKALLQKTAKQTGDILLFDNRIVLYKMEADVAIYVVGGVEENEILLYNVLLALRDALHLLFKQSVDKRTIIENYDLVSLAIDEIVDEGVVLETDPTIIVQRCSKAPNQDTNLGRIDPFTEQGMNNLAQIGKSKILEWMR